MPTAAQLDRLRALLGQLTPLANVQRGELIRAQDWNEVVRVLVELTRTVLTEEPQPATIPAHEHPDQVKITWLDPGLRAMVERGPLSDPAAGARLGDVERRIARLTSRLDQVQTDTTEVRNRVTEVSARDLARQAEVTSVRRTVEGIDGRRDDVQALRGALQAIQRDVQTAVGLGERLTVNGQPVDMAVVDQRIRLVEELRQRLTTPGGQLLDATGLENRLSQLTNTLVTQQQLDQALRTRVTEIPQGTLDGLRDSVATGVRQEMDGLIATRFRDFRTETNTRLGEIDATVGRGIADALPGVTQSTLAAVRPEIVAAVQRAAQDTQAAVSRQLGDSTTAIRAEVTAQLGDVRSALSREVASQLSTQLAPQLDSMRSTLNGLRDQTTGLAQRIAQGETATQALATRAEQLARDEGAARADLQRTLITEVQTRDSALAADLDRRLTGFSQGNQDQLNAAIVGLQRALTDQIQRAATDAAAAEARNLTTRLRGEMAAVAQDQVTALRGNMQTLVTGAVADAMRAVPGIVSQEVRRATANLPDMVKTEFTNFRPQLQTMVQREVSTSVVTRPAVSTVPGGLVAGPRIANP